jgi:hypothetical protein
MKGGQNGKSGKKALTEEEMIVLFSEDVDVMLEIMKQFKNH